MGVQPGDTSNQIMKLYWELENEIQMTANVNVRLLTQAHAFCLLLVKFLLVRARAIKLSGVGKMGTYGVGKSKRVRQKKEKKLE